MTTYVPGVVARIDSWRPLRLTTTALGSENVASTMLGDGPSGSLAWRSTTADVPTATEIAWSTAIGAWLAGGALTVTVADPEALTSRITLSKLREQSLAKQKH